ncbi:MAG: TolB family protein [Acidimicrobiia bacterium]
MFFDRPSGPDADPPREIATVATSGGEAQRLIGGAGQPAISPDGRLLAFVSYSPRTDQGQANGLNVVEIPETFDGWVPNVVGDGTVGEADQQISAVSWAPDSRQLVYTLLFSPQGSYPRVAESESGIRLDQAPIVPINDGSAVAGYLGDTGQMLGRTCVASNEPDQRLRVIVIDPQSGQETRHLFRYPDNLCGNERLTSDPSGRHVLALGAAGLYRWSEGDTEPTKIADGIRAAAWVPRVATCRDGDELPCDPGDENLQLTEKVVVAEGERNGVGWQLLAYDSEAGLCVGLRAGPGESGACGSGVPPLPISVGWGQQAGFAAFAQGFVRKDVTLVRLELSNGDTIETTPVGAEAGFEANFFVASLPEDIDLLRGIAIAADGRELGRQETPRHLEVRDTPEPVTENADPTPNQ